MLYEHEVVEYMMAYIVLLLMQDLIYNSTNVCIYVCHL